MFLPNGVDCKKGGGKSWKKRRTKNMIKIFFSIERWSHQTTDVPKTKKVLGEKCDNNRRDLGGKCVDKVSFPGWCHTLRPLTMPAFFREEVGDSAVGSVVANGALSSVNSASFKGSFRFVFFIPNHDGMVAVSPSRGSRGGKRGMRE